MKDSVIVLSGGMDSVTMLYEYQDRIAFALSFDYGSNHNARELAFAHLHCERLGIPQRVVNLRFIMENFHSSLLSGAADIPSGSYNDENMRSTVVPFRNGIMLSVAAGFAEDMGLKYIMLANHAGDHSIYPDCSPAFVDAMSDATKAGTYNHVEVFAPYTNLSKTDIAKHGKALGIDYSETWSCYRGGEHHCGTCGTCVERREALRDAGIEDKTIYIDD
ncbi:MAG: 7-cyano-7-deazaguanine synthase QueC [Paludibacteraceae bacterium]|nr:7-cyano-7-deazaguanine synthase QueC [Paludibacteraceae bacterium]